MILLRLELPGKCSPASWAPCLPGDLGKVKPVSGDRSMKTSPKGRVWAQKSTLLCRAPGFPGSAQPANRKTFHEALRRYLRKRKVESFKEESSALSKNCFKKKKLINFCGFNKSKGFCGFPSNFSPFSIKTKANFDTIFPPVKVTTFLRRDNFLEKPPCSFSAS